MHVTSDTRAPNKEFPTYASYTVHLGAELGRCDTIISGGCLVVYVLLQGVVLMQGPPKIQ